MRPNVRSWHPPGSSQPGNVSQGLKLTHCTNVVGCQVVAMMRSLGCVSGAARGHARLARHTVQDTRQRTTKL